MKWTISIPTWGLRCLDTFERFTFPATLKALSHAASEATFIIHTNDPDRVARVMGGHRPHRVCFMNVPQIEDVHTCLGVCHKDAIALAPPGNVMAFINADMVPSIEMFSAAEQRIALGKKLIMLAGTRTIGEPPVGARSADLLEWAMEHQHPGTTAQFFYGKGKSVICSMVYFESHGNIVLRAWHLHPFAAVVDRALIFHGVTIDCDLQDIYTTDEIHVVTNKGEAAFVELSPPDKIFATKDAPIDEGAILNWAKDNATSPLHDWFFEHRIGILGARLDVGDELVCARILKQRGQR
jgi:hypothetical protein